MIALALQTKFLIQKDAIVRKFPSIEDLIQLAFLTMTNMAAIFGVLFPSMWA